MVPPPAHPGGHRRPRGEHDIRLLAPLARAWLGAEIVLYFVSGIGSFALFVPAIRAQLAEAERSPGGPAYQAAARRSRLMAWVGVAIVVVVVWLMVVKPGAPVTHHAPRAALVRAC